MSACGCVYCVCLCVHFIYVCVRVCVNLFICVSESAYVFELYSVYVCLHMVASVFMSVMSGKGP